VETEGQIPANAITLEDDGLMALIQERERIAEEMTGNEYPQLAKAKRDVNDGIVTKLAVEGEGEYTFIVNNSYLLRLTRSTKEEHVVEAKTSHRIKVEDVPTS